MSEIVDENVLAPCPLPACNGKAKYIDYEGMGGVAIRCTTCEMETGDETKEYVTTLWNTRAITNDNGVVEALEYIETLINIREMDETMMPNIINELHLKMKHLTKIKSILTKGG